MERATASSATGSSAAGSSAGAWPVRFGGALAIASATLFGLSTPFVQRFGGSVGPYLTASLLYAGAALASLRVTGSSGAEAPVRVSHAPRLLGVALLGAVVAPVCLAWGLQRTSATFASLLLATEAVFTVALARAVYREAVSARVGVALLCIGVAAMLLVSSAERQSATSTIGALAVVGAAVAWASDNTFSRPLADLDPRRVVLVKSLLGSALSLVLALANGERWPARMATLGLLVTGGLGYGASLRLYLLAQRRIGAARTGSIFAMAPFVGAVAAWGLGDRSAGWGTLAAGVAILVGLYLHLTERHGHTHLHVAMHHEHAHRHDDGHHTHVHDPPFAGEHSHPHDHTPLAHEHPHGEDVHHRHEH